MSDDTTTKVFAVAPYQGDPPDHDQEDQARRSRYRAGWVVLFAVVAAGIIAASTALITLGMEGHSTSHARPPAAPPSSATLSPPVSARSSAPSVTAPPTRPAQAAGGRPADPAVPAVDVNPGDRGTFALGVKPPMISVAGPENIVMGLTWDGWDNKGATGHGTLNGTTTPVVIYLNNPVHGVFSLLTEEVQGQASLNIPMPTKAGQPEGAPTVSVPKSAQS